jgi:hypothetical protein
MVNVIGQSLRSDFTGPITDCYIKTKGYCYHLVNVNNLFLFQSDHINLLPLYIEFENK